MDIERALKRIEDGYGGVEEARVVREVLQAMVGLAHEGIMALLDHDLSRIRLQLKRIQALARRAEEEER